MDDRHRYVLYAGISISFRFVYETFFENELLFIMIAMMYVCVYGREKLY